MLFARRSRAYKGETRLFCGYYSKKNPKEQLHFVTFPEKPCFICANSQKIHAQQAENSLPGGTLCGMITQKRGADRFEPTLRQWTGPFRIFLLKSKEAK